ncbi:MAG: helix-turn-helix domain-containing protein [Actinomycetes bacterium]
MSVTHTASLPIGTLIRRWRERRRLTQLELSIQAQVSARHLSFVETGRSRPTSEMILHLSEQLDVPLRERNTLLLAGGYAPAYPQHALTAPPMSAISAAIDTVLAAHGSMPTVVVDRHWELSAYPGGDVNAEYVTDSIIVPLRCRTSHGELSLFSTTTVFGAPLDITVAELAIECFYPANDSTTAALKRYS